MEQKISECKSCEVVHYFSFSMCVCVYNKSTVKHDLHDFYNENIEMGLCGRFEATG